MIVLIEEPRMRDFSYDTFQKRVGNIYVNQYIMRAVYDLKCSSVLSHCYFLLARIASVYR